MQPDQRFPSDEDESRHWYVSPAGNVILRRVQPSALSDFRQKLKHKLIKLNHLYHILTAISTMLPPQKVANTSPVSKQCVKQWVVSQHWSLQTTSQLGASGFNYKSFFGINKHLWSGEESVSCFYFNRILLEPQVGGTVVCTVASQQEACVGLIHRGIRGQSRVEFACSPSSCVG